MQWETLNITIEGLQEHYKNKDLNPHELIEYIQTRSKEFEHKNIWITMLSDEQLTPYLENLEKSQSKDLPLYGIPFAIKDNIDLAMVPTTAACPEFSYTPTKHAFVVQQLIDAGAIPIGKTNLDQFATGLVGTRSPEPWGPCKNAFDDDYISGGSSSGSAVAVSLGLASFSLGTDTAGSGRIPAAFNNLVGLKPTKGLLSSSGLVPACKSLDTISIFSLNADDANTVFNVAAQYDETDAYSRPNSYSNTSRYQSRGNTPIHIAIPKKENLKFFDDEHSQSLFLDCIKHWKELGATFEEIDFEPFAQAASLLYEGPWVSERYLAIQNMLEAQPEAVHPVVKEIIEGGKTPLAIDAFAAQYKLQSLKKQCDQIINNFDFILTPTAGTSYKIAELLENPIQLNSNLGYYTNYMNLLDYSAIAVPYKEKTSNIPLGFTLVANNQCDQKLLAYAKLWQDNYAKQLGNTAITYTHKTELPFYDNKKIKVVVCGAHLAGQPLNWQLIERGGKLVEATESAKNYRLFALADGKRPGMLRDEASGESIKVEVWELPSENFGSFVNEIPAPLGIGRIELADDSWESGFICEPYGLEGAKDITRYSGWEAYLTSK